MQIISTEITTDDIIKVIANAYKVEPSCVELVTLPFEVTPPIIQATIKTDLEGVKRAAKILNKASSE